MSAQMLEVSLVRSRNGAPSRKGCVVIDEYAPTLQVQFSGRCHPYASPPQKRFLVLRSMQLTHHATRPTAHGAARLVQAMSAWSVKSRRDPSRHCRNAKVYGRKTTAMHNMSTPLPPPCHGMELCSREVQLANRKLMRVCCCLEPHTPNTMQNSSSIYPSVPQQNAVGTHPCQSKALPTSVLQQTNKKRFCTYITSIYIYVCGIRYHLSHILF